MRKVCPVTCGVCNLEAADMFDEDIYLGLVDAFEDAEVPRFPLPLILAGSRSSYRQTDSTCRGSNRMLLDEAPGRPI